MKTTDNDTICAISTASGTGAISIIRISGKDALSIASNIFSKSLLKVESHTVHFGTIQNFEKEIIDEVLITVLRDGRSYTGENTVEISCHGSLYIRSQIMNLLLQAGCRAAQPGEYTMRSYLNGKMDLSQAEAVADLIASDTKKSHETAINQMRGGYSDKIRNLRQSLMDFASLIELELDFSDEDVEFADRSELKKLISELKEKLSLLTQSFAYGNMIKNGVNTVIAGRPNAGKSTLLNALLEEDRAIVSDIPGTTRDSIKERLVIAGIQYNFIDTAGIREAKDEIEKIGVARTFSEIEKSKILLYVFDIKELTLQEVENDLKQLKRSGLSILVLANKTDKVDDLNYGKKILEFPIIFISAKNHKGLEELKNELSIIVESLSVESDTIVVNARHFEAFSKALSDIIKVKAGLESGITEDFLAMDIRSAARHLSSITGEITNEDLLGNIFSKFCIGK